MMGMKRKKNVTAIWRDRKNVHLGKEMWFAICVLDEKDSLFTQIYANAKCANAICDLCFRSAPVSISLGYHYS